MTTSHTSYTCGSCGKNLKKSKKLCPNCGSGLVDIKISIHESIDVKSSINLKKFKDGFSKFITHLKQGWYPSRDNKNFPKGVNLLQLIDRENNFYKKKVIDNTTGKIVKDVEEKLEDHRK